MRKLHKDTSKALQDMILDRNVKYLTKEPNGQHLEFWNDTEGFLRCVDPHDRGSGWLHWDYVTFLTLGSSHTIIKIQ